MNKDLKKTISALVKETVRKDVEADCVSIRLIKHQINSLEKRMRAFMKEIRGRK